MSKKVKRDKSKSRRERGRGASKAVGGPVASAPASEGQPAPEAPEGQPDEQQPAGPELLGAPKPPKPPKPLARIKAPEKVQRGGHSTAVGGRGDTSQLRAKARAQERKMQGQRNGNR